MKFLFEVYLNDISRMTFAYLCVTKRLLIKIKEFLVLKLWRIIFEDAITKKCFNAQLKYCLCSSASSFAYTCSIHRGITEDITWQRLVYCISYWITSTCSKYLWMEIIIINKSCLTGEFIVRYRWSSVEGFLAWILIFGRYKCKALEIIFSLGKWFPKLLWKVKILFKLNVFLAKWCS